MKGFGARQIATMLHSMAKARYRPANGTFSSELERHAETVIGLFCAQELANTLWAYATMKRQPGKGLMRALEGQTAAIAGTFNAQNVAKIKLASAARHGENHMMYADRQSVERSKSHPIASRYLSSNDVDHQAFTRDASTKKHMTTMPAHAYRLRAIALR